MDVISTPPPLFSRETTMNDVKRTMKMFFLSAGAALLLLGCVIASTLSSLLGLIFVAGGIFSVLLGYDTFSPTCTKWTSITVWALMLPLIFIGSAVSGAKVKWQSESSDAALPRPKKEIDPRSQHEKNLELSLQQIVENTGKIIEHQNDDRQIATERYSSLKGNEDVRRDFERDGTGKIKPTPETERTPPEVVIPEEIPGEIQPPVAFKGNLISKAEPKQPIPEQRAKVVPKAGATHLMCSCGKVHEIERIEGSIVQYSCCADASGNPICHPESFGTLNRK